MLIIFSLYNSFGHIVRRRSSLVPCELEEASLAHPFAWTASGGVVVLPAAALLAALGPQLTPCWAALVRLVAPVAAPLAALGPQLTLAGVALA